MHRYGVKANQEKFFDDFIVRLGASRDIHEENVRDLIMQRQVKSFPKSFPKSYNLST